MIDLKVINDITSDFSIFVNKCVPKKPQGIDEWQNAMNFADRFMKKYADTTHSEFANKLIMAYMKEVEK